jgi:type IV secretion system protein TrbJ
MSKRILAIAALILTLVAPAGAQFGGHVVFDPSMYARQLEQLNQEISTVSNLASQLEYVIKNTTGGGGGIWASNGSFLSGLGQIIQTEQGLSYTYSELSAEFQQLYPGYAASTSAPTPQQSVDVNLNTLNGALQDAQAQAQQWQTEQSTLSMLEMKNQTAIGNLQVAQTGNEIALAQVQQLQNLQQLMAAMMNSQNVNAASATQAQTMSQMSATAIMGAAPQVLTLAPGPGPALPLVGGNIP